MLPLPDGCRHAFVSYGPAPRAAKLDRDRSGIVSRTRVRPQRLEERRGIDLGAAQQSLERQSASDGSLGDSRTRAMCVATRRRSIIMRRSTTRWSTGASLRRRGSASGRAAFCSRSAPSRGGRRGNMASAPFVIVSSTPGHAIGAAAQAAAALGWRAHVLREPSDDEIAALLGLTREDAAHRREREHPELLPGSRSTQPAAARITMILDRIDPKPRTRSIPIA